MKINIDEKKDKKLADEAKNKQSVRELEQFYTNGKVDTMLKSIDKKRDEVIAEMEKYAKENTKPVKWNEEGQPVKFAVDSNPLVVLNYFFKPITPLSCQEPIYSAEQLGMIFDYYCEILANVNAKIGYFPSSLTSFCKLAGITTSTLRQYKASPDYNMRVVAEKIYDQIGDENITMSQMGYVKERTTIFKMKSQNEIVEKVQPNININITEKPDIERIAERIGKYKAFANKKEK